MKFQYTVSPLCECGYLMVVARNYQTGQGTAHCINPKCRHKDVRWLIELPTIEARREVPKDETLTDELNNIFRLACTHIGPWPDGLACKECFLNLERQVMAAKKQEWDARVRAKEIIPL